MLGESALDQQAIDVAPSARHLARIAVAARVRSFHGSFMCLARTGTGLFHVFRPDPDDTVFLIQPLVRSGFGLLYAERPFSPRADQPTRHLHLVRMIPVPLSDRFLLCDPLGQECLNAHQDWLLNQGGPIGFGAVQSDPGLQYSFDIIDAIPIADESVAAAALTLMTMLDRDDGADPNGGSGVAAGDGPGSPGAGLADTLRAARRMPRADHAQLGARAHLDTGPGRLVRDCFLPIGRFEHRLEHDPSRSGIRPWLGGGWHVLSAPNFDTGVSAADKPIRVFATGRRATISFALPYRPSQARLRLAIAEVAGDAEMTVSTHGWELGRSTIRTRGDAKRRLDFIIAGEAIQSDRLAIQITFDQPPQADGSVGHLFLLSGCQLELGPEVSPVDIPDDPADLLNRFESIGGNCEFGFLQRHFGLERLGLLTFAGVRHLTSLMDMLDQGFAGLGTPGSIEAEEVVFNVRARNMPPRDVNEFWITNRRYQFEMHSFKGPDHHSRAEAIRENEKKLSYLSRKLVEDLEDGAKILVYKDVRQTGLNDLLSLHASLNRYGPNRLFWVTHAVPGRPPGSVDWIAPNLLRGYSFNPHYDVQWFNADHWLLLCRRAYAAFMRSA